jgi:hypothetical protein
LSRNKFYKKLDSNIYLNDINFVTLILIYFYIFSQSSFSGRESDSYSDMEGVDTVYRDVDTSDIFILLCCVMLSFHQLDIMLDSSIIM